MSALRYEIFDCIEAWAFPGGQTRGLPLASGTFHRVEGTQDGQPAPGQNWPAITVPESANRAAHVLLVLTSFGVSGWVVTFGKAGTVPQAVTSATDVIETPPRQFIAGTSQSDIASPRESLAVRPGMVFVARPIDANIL